MFNLRHIVLVAIGGSIGSVLRYVAGLFINVATGTTLFPWGTFAVNIVGSFIIGLVFGYSMHHPQFELNWRLFLATGVCGGFTTFSAFSNESFLLLKQEQYGLMLVYVCISILVSIAATAAGYWLSR